MEVHSHTHTDRKKWTHYLWEFLMLFLAVFCGFLAENIREHQVERARERQYIGSLVEDLGEDTITLAEAISELRPNIRRLDTLIQLLNSPEVTNHGSDMYYFARRASRGSDLALQDRTIQQMKNSGAFRLISNEKVAKAILEYYNRILHIEFLQAIELTETTEYRKMAINIFHPVIFDGTVQPDNSISRPAGNPSLLVSDVPSLLHLAGMISYIKNSRIGLTAAEIEMKVSGINLIALLKREYHLK